MTTLGDYPKCMLLIFIILPSYFILNLFLCFSCKVYLWHEADLQLMQMSQLLLTAVTLLLKRLIILDNARLALQSSGWMVLCSM